MRELAGSLSSRRIWLLLDEWSSVPNDVQQPYLGEFLVRCILPLQDRLTVKIAAIEQQSQFRGRLPTGDVIITPAGERQMAALRWIASIAGEDQNHRDGWCRWGIPEGDPWTWDDYRPLVGAGLVERRETWWDVLLRLTTEGWAALGRSHVVG